MTLRHRFCQRHAHHPSKLIQWLLAPGTARGACPSLRRLLQSRIVLTRSGVAKRLNRSIATVRRLEGYELFPCRDSRGVHWFDEYEVTRVAQLLKTAALPAAQSRWLARSRRSVRSAADPAPRLRSIVPVLRRLEMENAALRAQVEQLELQLAADPGVR
jgi:hypothetical protein